MDGWGRGCGMLGMAGQVRRWRCGDGVEGGVGMNGWAAQVVAGAVRRGREWRPGDTKNNQTLWRRWRLVPTSLESTIRRLKMVQGEMRRQGLFAF